jgi:hypothetical protein
MKQVKSEEFVTGAGRRVLTDNGSPGMGGKEGIGSTTERLLGRVATAIFENCGDLDNQQLDEIISWIELYKR